MGSSSALLRTGQAPCPSVSVPGLPPGSVHSPRERAVDIAWGRHAGCPLCKGTPHSPLRAPPFLPMPSSLTPWHARGSSSWFPQPGAPESQWQQAPSVGSGSSQPVLTFLQGPHRPSSCQLAGLCPLPSSLSCHSPLGRNSFQLPTTHGLKSAFRWPLHVSTASFCDHCPWALW